MTNKKLLILLLSLSLAVTSFAADRIKVRKFSGLATRVNPYEIQDSESPDMSNFVLDEAGSLTERTLWQHYNTTTIGTTPVTNVYKFYKPSDASFLLVTSGIEIYKGSGGIFTTITEANKTVTNNSNWSFETFTDGTNELVFIVNNDINLSSWNGIAATISEEGDFPAEKCNLLKKHKSRLFAAGETSFPYRLYYSSLSDGDDWSTTGGTILNTITKCKELSQDNTNSIWQM